MAKGKVKVIAKIYSLNDISRTDERVMKGEARFRVVITI
jgi:D-arabinose 1-dehydrogenase-like Zn-dependent alcohol dehydrogenase